MPGQPSDLIGRRLGGRFLIDRCRGQLPQGWLFDAKDEADGRSVGVRLLSGVPAPGPYFEREARRIRALHPDLVARVYGAFRLPDGTAGLVTEPMLGVSLAERLGEGPLSLPSAVALIDALIQALIACHMMGVVHRDLRPENIWLASQPGAMGKVVLHGAGVADLVGAKRGAQGAFIFGDPRYMAPEQWVDRAVDGRADMYGVAMLGYLSLMGQPLVDGDDAMAVCEAHFATPRPTALSALGGDVVPDSLLAALAKAAAPDRAERFPSLEVFQSALTSARFSLT